MAASSRRIDLLLPGDPDTRTGGYGYDRRIVAGLEARGWKIRLQRLHACFPDPDAAALQHAEMVLADLPAEHIVVIDGLAFGTMPQIVQRYSDRLRLIALIHHPLAAETGLPAARAQDLARLEARALRFAQGVIVTSRSTATAVEAMGVPKERIQIVEPGVDQAPLARAPGDVPFQLLCVATCVPRKGHAVLLEALAKVGGHDWQLTIAGSEKRSPATARAIHEQIRSLGLSQRVRFLGEVDDTRLARCYAAADLFVLASMYEGYGMVITEAIACGLPVISTRAGAIPQTLPKGTGLLVAPGDASALAGAVLCVLRTPGVHQRLRAASRAARRSLQSWADAAECFEHALDQLTTPVAVRHRQ